VQKLLSVGSEKDPVLAFCKHGDKRLNSLKATNFLTRLNTISW